MSDDINGIENITEPTVTNISKILNCCELKENEFENILKDFEKYEKKFNKNKKIINEVIESGEKYEIEKKKIDLSEKKNREILIKFFNIFDKKEKFKNIIKNFYKFYSKLKKGKIITNEKNNKEKINLNNKSILKIFDLIYDDKNFYNKIDFKNLNDNKIENNNINKLKNKKITNKDNKKNYSNINNNETQTKQKRKYLEIPDKYKQSILIELIKNNKDNYCISKIASKPEFFYKIWTNLYEFLLIFFGILFLGWFIYLINCKSLNLLFLINLVLLIILFYTFYIGTKKLKLKKIEDFNTENNLLYFIGVCSLINLLSTKISFISGSGFKFMNDYLILIFFIFLCLIILVILIILSNKKMIEFYEKYEKEKYEGNLLMNIETEDFEK